MTITNHSLLIRNSHSSIKGGISDIFNTEIFIKFDLNFSNGVFWENSWIFLRFLLRLGID